MQFYNQSYLTHRWVVFLPIIIMEGIRGAIHIPSFKLLQELEIPTSNVHNTMENFLTNHNQIPYTHHSQRKKPREEIHTNPTIK